MSVEVHNKIADFMGPIENVFFNVYVFKLL